MGKLARTRRYRSLFLLDGSAGILDSLIGVWTQPVAELPAGRHDEHQCHHTEADRFR